MMKRAAEFAIRRPRTVVALWLVVFLVGVGLGSGVFGKLHGLGANVPGSESDVTATRLDKLDPGSDTIVGLVAGAGPGQRVAALPGVRDRVEAAVADLRRIPNVVDVADPYQDPAGAGADGRLVPIPVTFKAGLDTSDDGPGAAALAAAETRLRAISQGPGDVVTVKVGGGPIAGKEMDETAQGDASRAEMLSLPVVLVLLLLVFGGFFAAALPLILALCGVAATLLILFGFSYATDLSVYSVQITTMLGLGLGVDYALLMVARFKQERGRTPDREAVADCVRRTVDRAGRTVFFSGLTVAVSLAGIVVYQAPFLRSMGLAATAVVAVDMLAAVTLLPALLARWGHRVAPADAAKARRRGGEGRFFAGVAGAVVRRPLPALLGVAAALISVAAPVTGLAWAAGDARELPKSAEARQVYELVQQNYPDRSQADSVVVLIPAAAATPAYVQHLKTLPGVVRSTDAKQLPDGSSVLRLTPAGVDDGPAATGLVQAIRDERTGATVTGNTAHLLDFKRMLTDRLPYAVAVVLLSVLVLLFLFTGSVVIPLKAVLTNLLSIGAALGAVVWAFQDGHLGGLFGTGRLGSLDVTIPPLMITVAFGLSMDYEIFILGRIREARLAGEDARSSVVTGIRHTGRIVTSAALLLMVVFACFMTGGAAPILEFGLGLTLAIGIDATLVRMLLVPATLAALGERAWWAPKPLARLHRRFGLSEGGAAAGETAAVAGPRRESQVMHIV